MRKMNFISALFGMFGIGALLLGILLALGNRNAKPLLISQPEAARQQITEAMDALCGGDYAAASGRMYGTPDLGLDRDPSGEVGSLIWDAFVDSLSYELTGTCYATDAGLAQDLVVSGMDIDSVTATLGERSQALLEQRVAEAEDTAELYDEDNEFREELVMEVVCEAARQALEQDVQQRQWSITVNLVYENGQWWILPEKALLEAISGGILK